MSLEPDYSKLRPSAQTLQRLNLRLRLMITLLIHKSLFIFLETHKNFSFPEFHHHIHTYYSSVLYFKSYSNLYIRKYYQCMFYNFQRNFSNFIIYKQCNYLNRVHYKFNSQNGTGYRIRCLFLNKIRRSRHIHYYIYFIATNFLK